MRLNKLTNQNYDILSNEIMGVLKKLIAMIQY